MHCYQTCRSLVCSTFQSRCLMCSLHTVSTDPDQYSAGGLDATRKSFCCNLGNTPRMHCELLWYCQCSQSVYNQKTALSLLNWIVLSASFHNDVSFNCEHTEHVALLCYVLWDFYISILSTFMFHRTCATRCEDYGDLSASDCLCVEEYPTGS